YKAPVGGLGDEGGHGGLAHAGGAVEHHVGDLPGLKDAPQRPPRAQNMLLAHHLVQGGGTDPVCQRRSHRSPPFSRKIQNCYHSIIFPQKTQPVRRVPPPLSPARKALWCPPPSRLPARSVRGRAPPALAHPSPVRIVSYNLILF